MKRNKSKNERIDLVHGLHLLSIFLLLFFCVISLDSGEIKKKKKERTPRLDGGPYQVQCVLWVSSCGTHRHTYNQTTLVFFIFFLFIIFFRLCVMPPSEGPYVYFFLYIQTKQSQIYTQTTSAIFSCLDI